MTGISYNANFFQSEVRRLTSAVLHAGAETRASLQHQLDSAKSHLASLSR
jgi:hypothetical protein